MLIVLNWLHIRFLYQFLVTKLNNKRKKHAMKRFNLLSAVIAVVLMVTAVSCTTMRGTEDDYYYDRTQYDRVQPSNRIYVDDPYRGTIVLERDPYTGRYYEVGSYGGNYGYRNDRYSNVYRNN